MVGVAKNPEKWKALNPWMYPKRMTKCLVGALVLVLIVGIVCIIVPVEISRLRLRQETGVPEANISAPTTIVQQERLDAVKSEFLHAWSGYKNQSWMSDTLKPISGGIENNLCGWAATLIDSLDSLYIMDMHDEFEDAVEGVLTINFGASTADCTINFFETTIRYLGGMLAAYDLSGDERLKPKLLELGEILYTAFNTTTGLPCNHCELGKRKSMDMTVPDTKTPLANAFSFSLEFARLSQVTGDQKYLDKVLSVSEIYQRAQNESSLPGLWPEEINAASIEGANAEFVTASTRYGLGALSDSAYEYLVKTHLLIGGVDDRFSKMWSLARSQIKDHLLFGAYVPQPDQTNALFTGIATTKPEENASTVLEPRIEHLACFAGGMFALSSRIFDNRDDLATAEALANGCVWAYENSPLGIMPETVTLLPCPMLNLSTVQSNGATSCSWDEQMWQDASGKTSNFPKGFVSSLDTHYGLRPEAIESVFMMYRATNDPKWRDIGWEMFNNIITQTRAQFGHAALVDVMGTRIRERTGDKSLAQQKDQMESFWLAETLKYFFLLFSDPTALSLDEFVLNTEAHPLRLTKSTMAAL